MLVQRSEFGGRTTSTRRLSETVKMTTILKKCNENHKKRRGRGETSILSLQVFYFIPELNDAKTIVSQHHNFKTIHNLKKHKQHHP